MSRCHVNCRVVVVYVGLPRKCRRGICRVATSIVVSVVVVYVGLPRKCRRGICRVAT